MDASNVSINTKSSGAFKRQAFKDQITGILFTLPALLIILIFGIFPIGYSIYMSLFNWQVT
ncbi:MAG: sugar ABC transporter permease, partial [Chloroflexi bacterium]|nr:sugar ABC transporter permease [Chloroflexota bacterium]